jgi:hypothetical protein
VAQRTCYGSLADLPQIPYITRAASIECWPRCIHRVAGLCRFTMKGVSKGFVVKVAGGVEVASVDKWSSLLAYGHAGIPNSLKYKEATGLQKIVKRAGWRNLEAYSSRVRLWIG